MVTFLEIDLDDFGIFMSKMLSEIMLHHLLCDLMHPELNLILLLNLLQIVLMPAHFDKHLLFKHKHILVFFK